MIQSWKTRTKIVYEKHSPIGDLVICLMLMLYPMLNANHGLSVVDTTYSLSNFRFFHGMKGTWMVATFLSNVCGAFFMHLPGGESVLGMNLYTRVCISLLAVAVYLALRKLIEPLLLLTGELIAISYCWCPTTILYNYLTYLVMGCGILFLWKAIWQEQKKYFVLAGIFLGMNVAVRMPNVVQAGFILVVFYAGHLYEKQCRQVVSETALCMGGYALGFGIPFVTICVKYGVSAYSDMVQTMFAMTDTAQDYKPTSMIDSMFADYRWMLPYAILFFLCVIMGVAFCILGDVLYGKLEPAGGKLRTLWNGIKITGCVCLAFFVVRVLWGRGIFSFRYFEYSSMYGWGVLFLLLTILCCLACLFGKTAFYGHCESKVIALTVLLQLFLTPLGSNNGLYPILNNLFLAAPFTLWYLWHLLKPKSYEKNDTPIRIAASSCVGVILIMVMLQGILFHQTFALQDGVWGEERNSVVSTSWQSGQKKTKGIKTTADNANFLGELLDYAGTAMLKGNSVILYGEVPGLGYFLDMPSALSTFWADLPSYRMVEYERDMQILRDEIEIGKEKPVIVVSSQVAAWYDEDGEAMRWFGVDTDAFSADRKLEILTQFMKSYGYEQTFCNGAYAVYR